MSAPCSRRATRDSVSGLALRSGALSAAEKPAPPASAAGAARRRRGRAARVAALLALVSLGCGTLSVPEEQSLGRQMAAEVRRELVFVHDPVIVGYVRNLGESILRAAGPQPFEYRFYVVESDEINAFAGPAGYIYVHTQTILAARNASELAGVIAHEIGHVQRRHIAN